jgi:putative tryptophan/tyrosine transport system substrate-binding protein
MRKLSFLLIVTLLAALFSVPVIAQDEELPKVGIFKFVSHPALDANEQGIVDTLAAAGYVDGETVELLIASGEGEIAAMNTIAENFVFDENVDVIMAISTPALQAAFNVTGDLPEDDRMPIFFSSVTSPYVAGVAEASCIKPAWVSGSQAFAPYDQTVPLIFELVPDAETVGYIYNTAEANSVANTDAIIPIAEELGLTMNIQEISTSAEVPTAAEALVSQGIDVFFVATDSTLVAGLEGLVAVANENEIPIIASDPSSGERGTVLAQGLDYYQEGIDSGRMAVAYLNGDLDVATTSISRQQGTQLAVNLDAAASQGVNVPEALLETALIIIEDGEVSTVEREMMSEEEMMSAAEAFLADLECTEEIIAEQQAELDAQTE